LVIGGQVWKRREVGHVCDARRYLTLATASESNRLQIAVLGEGLHDAVEVALSFGVAFALASTSASTRGPVVTFESTQERASVLADAPLEALRRSIPAARALPLLALLARGESGRAVIDYLDGLSLAVDVAQ
jgi:hypothetical protein